MHILYTLVRPVNAEPTAQRGASKSIQTGGSWATMISPSLLFFLSVESAVWARVFKNTTKKNNKISAKL